MERPVERATRLLEEEGLPFSPEGVEKVAHRYGLKVEDLGAFTQEVLKEGSRRVVRVLEKLWRTLGIPPPWEAVEYLRIGGGVWVRYYGADEGKVEVEVGEWALGTTSIRRTYSSTSFQSPEWFVLQGAGGLVEVETSSGLEVIGRRVFFVGGEYEEPEKSLEGAFGSAKALAPVFSAMGVGGLDRALQVLAKLEEGESQVEGEYFLFRGRDKAFLRRGLMSGDPALERKLFAGQEVKLAFPGEVEFSLKAQIRGNNVFLEDLRVRIGQEEARFAWGSTLRKSLLGRDPLLGLIQEGFKRELEGTEVEGSPHLKGLSARAIAFLKAFAKHEDPFRVLAEGRFDPHTAAEFFLEF